MQLPLVHFSFSGVPDSKQFAAPSLQLKLPFHTKAVVHQPTTATEEHEGRVQSFKMEKT